MINTGGNAPIPNQANAPAPAQNAPMQNAPAQNAPMQTPPQASAPAQSAGGVAPPFMKGAAAQQAMQQEQQRAEMRNSGTFRFYVKVNNGQSEERMITFLDGNLTPEGLLDIPFINEHRVRINGESQNIACTEPNETCPLCQLAQENNSQDYGYAAFVGFLTVIDHTGYVDKQGVHHKDVVRLYVAKRKQIEVLTKMANNYGTLAGVTFMVSRSSDKSSAVGDIMIPQSQYNVNDLLAYYKQQDPQTKIGVLDYNKEVTYFDANSLRTMLGMGNPMGGMPNNPVQQQYDVNQGLPNQQASLPQAQPLNQQPLAGDVSQQPQASAPAPTPPNPVHEQPQAQPQLQMIATDYTYQQYITAGWDDQMLVDKGKAQWVQAAAAPAPAQNAPAPVQQPQFMTQQHEQPQNVAANAPFQPTDPNVPDTNTDLSDQM